MAPFYKAKGVSRQLKSVILVVSAYFQLGHLIEKHGHGLPMLSLVKLASGHDQEVERVIRFVANLVDSGKGAHGHGSVFGLVGEAGV